MFNEDKNIFNEYKTFFIISQVPKPGEFKIIMVANECVMETFKNSDKIKKITIQDLALDLELLNHFNLISMYAESFIYKTPISQNPIDIMFGINRESAELEYAIDFMVDYLNGFITDRKNRVMTKETELLLYSTSF